MSDPQSFNRYAYANNDPVNFTDPLGLDPSGVLGAGLGILGAVEIGQTPSLGDVGTVTINGGGNDFEIETGTPTLSPGLGGEPLPGGPNPGPDPPQPEPPQQQPLCTSKGPGPELRYDLERLPFEYAWSATGQHRGA